MLEQLRIVLEAEAEARQRLEAARAAAKRLVNAAEEDARRAVQQARAAQEAVARSVAEEWVQQARHKAEAIEEEMQVRVKALQARAEPRVEHAVEALVRRVLGAEPGDGQ